MSRSEYPTHEFSKYIDQNFSFSNTVYPSKETQVDKLKFMRVDGSMMLEPRLQEYIKRVKFNKDNNIKPCVPETQEFQISDRDLRDIRCFFAGKPLPSMQRDGDRGLEREFWRDEYLTNQDKRFPSTEMGLRDDSRVLKPNKKENRDIPVNRGMFVPDSKGAYYESSAGGVLPNGGFIMDGRDLAGDASSSSYGPPLGRTTYDITGSGFNMDDTRLDPRVDRHMYQGTKSKKYNPQDSQYRVTNKNNKDNSCDYNMLSTIGDKMDISYENVDTDIYRMDGVPQHTTKSYGHRNPVEHYFHYIDRDFQNAENSVEPWTRGGQPTRLSNTTTARPKYCRKIM